MYRIVSLSNSFKSKKCSQSFSWFSRIEEYFKENNVKLIPDVRDIFEDPPPIDMLKGTKSWITVNDKDYGGTSELSLARGILKKHDLIMIRFTYIYIYIYIYIRFVSWGITSKRKNQHAIRSKSQRGLCLYQR